MSLSNDGCLFLSCCLFFFFNDTATTEIYTLSLHDALPIAGSSSRQTRKRCAATSKSARSWRSEEHTSELQSPCNLVCRLLLEKKNGDTTTRSEIPERKDARLATTNRHHV